MTIQEILALIGIKIPDNNVKKITAKDVRDSFALLGEEVDDKIDKDAGNLTEPQVQHLKEVLGIGDAGIQDITAGDNITIDKSDPKNPKISASATQMVFATQSEMENQTPPDSENNKAVSLFGLWKWVKKLNYLYLNITTANSTLNKIWYDGINTWVTNKDGVNKQLAYDENGVNIPQGRITTTTSITTETKTNSNLSQNGKNVIIDNGANNINLTVNAFAGGNFCATYIKDGTGTITIVAGSGVSLDLVQYTDVVNGKSGSRFMISQNGSTNTFKIFVRNYE